jgi:hypothetical protein
MIVCLFLAITNFYDCYPVEDEDISCFGLGVGRVVAADLDLAVLPQPAVVLQLHAGRQAPVSDARLQRKKKNGVIASAPMDPGSKPANADVKMT